MRAIDADALILHLTICQYNGLPTSKFYAIDDVIHYVKTMPTIESKRKRGKWISRGEDCYECSECHAVIEGDEVYWRNNYFCYHCGADMRGEENGE